MAPVKMSLHPCPRQSDPHSDRVVLVVTLIQRRTGQAGQDRLTEEALGSQTQPDRGSGNPQGSERQMEEKLERNTNSQMKGDWQVSQQP